MKKRIFGNTEMEVTEICLGAANYGSSIKEEEAIRQLNCYVENGGNFIDTARVYGDWIPGTKGLSEKILGSWLKSEGNRTQIILTSKGAHPLIESMEVSRVGIAELEQDLHESLEHLCTDYLDIYFLHRDNESVSVGELLEWLEAQKKKGYIRYYGCSNWPVRRMEEADAYAQEKGLTGFVSNQMLASLADVNPKWYIPAQMVAMTKEFDNYHEKTKKNLMAYTSINNGYFAKCFKEELLPEAIQSRYEGEANQKIYQKLCTVCSTEKEVMAYCYQHILKKPYSAIPITAFRVKEQLEECLEALKEEVDEAVVCQLAGMKEQR